MTSKRWTKKEIKAMTSAIDSFLVCNRPIAPAYGMRAGSADAFTVWFEERLAKYRHEIVCSGIRQLRSIIAERAQKNIDHAEHIRTHPEIYGSPDKMIWLSEEREHVTRDEYVRREIASWGSRAADEGKSVAWSDKLLARIAAEGLPPEVVSYDPRTR
jgi:hypothetical protein